MDRAAAVARARMPAPCIDRLLQFSGVGQFAAKTASAANSLGHRCFLSVSETRTRHRRAVFVGGMLSEHADRAVDRLYADGICANMIASVVCWVPAACSSALASYSSQDCLPAPPGLRAKPAFWLPPVPNRPHLAGCTADLPVFQPPCAAPILRAADNTAYVATHLERWGRQLLALPVRQDCIAVHAA